MLRSMKQICGDKLGASDGEIGHVKDFYFDDRNWAVRYLVADTGSWMPGRLVLISPQAFGNLYQGGKMLFVNLTRQQIENNPSIETHKPISRQYEEEYHRYYGWPFYWQGDALWGMSGFPLLSQRSEPFLAEQAAKTVTKHESVDAHLRSGQTVIGYHVQTRDGEAGRVIDFVMDDKDWAIHQLAVDTGHWLSGKKVLIQPSQIDRIRWDESKVFVDLTKKAVLGSPVFDPAAFGIREHDPRIFV